jgi:hypothetical protein
MTGGGKYDRQGEDKKHGRTDTGGKDKKLEHRWWWVQRAKEG